MNKIDKEKDLAWRFIMQTKPVDKLWKLSVAVFKILRDGEFWRSEVRKRQDTIYKLRSENKKLRKRLRDK